MEFYSKSYRKSHENAPELSWTAKIKIFNFILLLAFAIRVHGVITTSTLLHVMGHVPATWTSCYQPQALLPYSLKSFGVVCYTIGIFLCKRHLRRCHRTNEQPETNKQTNNQSHRRLRIFSISKTNVSEGILIWLKSALSVCYHWVGGELISTYLGEAAWTRGYRPGPAMFPAVLASSSVSTTCFCFILGRPESKNKIVGK